jgi:capsular exopolysaccharide synthesis family protein
MNDFHATSAAHSPVVSASESSDGLVQILGRQWHVIALVAVICLLLAGIYLMVARPVYTSEAKLLVQPLGSQIVNPGGGSSAGQGEISADFLNTECDVFTSNPVLALALGEIHKAGGSQPLHGLSTIRDLKTQLSANVSDKGGQTIDVSFSSTDPQEANRTLTAVVEAYQAFESNHWKAKVKESLDLLEQGKANQRKELQEKTQRMLALARQNGGEIDTDPDKSPARAQVRSLSEALTKARLDTINAKSAYDEAAKAIVGDAAKLQQVAALEKQAAYSANPGAQLTTIQTELFRYQANLAEAQRQYMPNHPIVKTIQARIDQLTVACVADAEQWWQASQTKEDALQESLAEAQKNAVEAEASAVQYTQLQADIASLKKVDDIDGRIKDLDLIRGAGATNIIVLDPAELTAAPSPRKGRTMAIALVLGLIAGLGVACARDWMDDRLRSPEAVQATIGVPVLGAVPAITTAFTAADRGQIVHNDPFSEASESYRTLRTALQYGLPQSTKTLLITSPAPGDGKSTLVSNLAIALAQANKRVLVIDADFRAPMQHRLFGLKDRRGMATVLGGADTLDQAIQRTEIEGLDLLPCGPIPHNPAEMLNDPAFAEHLNDLADRYDLVLLDSPPVTAVTDARIIAASADATLLVIRPEVSTRRHAEQARDGLRGVGARLIGVAINGVGHAGQFGAASGYASRAGLAPTDATRTSAARSPSASNSTIAGPMNRI